MNSFRFIILSVFLLILKISCKTEHCYNVINGISQKDICLSSRVSLKKEFAQSVNNSDAFQELMRNQTCSGTKINSNDTTSWVTEIFEGIKSQFYDLKSSSIPEFNSYTGDSMNSLFLSHNTSNSRIVYYMRHSGTHQLSWTIEKLSSQAGWVVYQSFDEVYSLRAWMNSNVTGYYNATSGDIRMWTSVPDRINTVIKNISDNTVDIDTINSQNAPSLKIDLSFVLPYINFLKLYNESQILSNLNIAQSQYGQTQILDWDSFNKYLETLGSVIDNFYNNYTTSNIYSQELWDKWISLHGAPDPLHYPNMTFSQIKNLIPSEDFFYDFEIKVIFPLSNMDCKVNDVFMNYLTTEAEFISKRYLVLMLSFYLIILFIN